jgi:hypothetical protein
MIQRDYILRMIEEMGKFLSRLLKLRKEGNSQKGFQAFEDFLKTHFKHSSDDFLAEGLLLSMEHLKEPLNNYPDELGQLFYSGAGMALEIDQRSKAQILFQLAWEAFRLAEKNSKTYRFERMVEMNAIREQLALMGLPNGDERP